MTLLKLFNKMLKDLPEISNDLQELVELQDWSEEKTRQAISIVKQIGKGDVVEKGLCIEYSYVGLRRAEITLCPSECGISSSVFKTENILQGDEYIQNLLIDINTISAYVTFSFGGHCYENDKCTFYISWEF